MKASRIGIVGSGYTGRTIGEHFLRKGHQVRFFDIKKEVLEELRSKGYDVAYEIGDLADLDIFFICVPTPVDREGNQVLDHVKEALKNLTLALNSTQREQIIVVKSTILPGTTQNILLPLIAKYSEKPEKIGLIYSPEFITEMSHTWTQDNSFKVSPENEYRLVLGEGDDKRWGDMLLQSLYPNPTFPVIRTDYKTAEMIKYASNIALACKISYWNEIFLIAQKIGVNSEIVAQTCALDPRIGRYGTVHGKAFGGKCLPKDLKAFIKFAESIHPIKLIKAIDEVNEYMRQHYGVRGEDDRDSN